MQTKQLKQIGKGAFSTVYRKTEKTVLIKTIDNVKECLSWEWHELSYLLPKLKQINHSDDLKFSFYECKYYEKVSSLKNTLSISEYDFYKELRKISTIKHNDYYKLFELFSALPAKYNKKKKILLLFLDSLANYGSDICFEISPRNVAVEKGKLILLDCFYFHKQLKKIQSK